LTIYQTISRILWVTRGSRALERVASGETDTIEGWLAYGAALNEGRGLFPSDEQFGQWVQWAGQRGGVTKRYRLLLLLR